MNQRKVKAAEHFGVHAFTLGHAIQLTAYRPFRQYCLQQAGAPSVKTFTLTQNVLRPFKIQILPNRCKAKIATRAFLEID